MQKKINTTTVPKKAPVSVLYCRSVDMRNIQFAKKESKDLGYKTISAYVNALLESRRMKYEGRKTKRTTKTNR